MVDLPQPGGRTELEALASNLTSTPLDPRRPLWQIHLVRRYQGGSAWITRIHRCYADGIAMILMLLSMTEQEPGDASTARGRRRAGPPARRSAGPRESGSMGIGISVLTCAGRVHVGMIADRRLVAHPQAVVDRFAPEFERL